MTRSCTLLVGALTALTLTALTLAAQSAAEASTLANADSRAYELRIEPVSGGARALEIAPGQTLDEVCPEGCELTLVGVEDATYKLEGNERVTIETGLIYYDGPLERPETDADTDTDTSGG